MITSLFSFLLLFSLCISKDVTKCPFPGHKDWVTTDNKTCYLLAANDFRTGIDKATWTEAEDKCLLYNARLLSIHDNITNELVLTFAKDSRASYIWLGLNSLEKRGSYKWSDGTPYNYDNFEIKSINSTNKPSISNPLGRCVALDVKGSKWVYQHCNDEESFYCEKSDFPVVTTAIPLGNCPEGWYEYANIKCIKIVGGKMTRDEAQQKCTSLDGELVSIHSFEEQNFITSLIFNKSSAWIGLEKLSKYPRQWTWIDQSQVTYTNWAVNNPEEYWGSNYCSYLLSSEIEAGNWVSSSCSKDNLGAICQTDKNSSIHVRPEPAFTSCQISGYQNFIQYHNSCYLLSNETENWDSAESTCRNSKSHLISVLDSFEYAFFTYYTQQFLKSDQIWIGFHAKILNSPQVLFKWIDNWPNFVSFWADNEPFINKTWNEACVYQDRKFGNWSTDRCDARKYFMCKITANPTPINESNNAKTYFCPESNSNVTKPWIDIYERSKYCYWFSIDDKKTAGHWSDAKFQCSKRGAKLVSIHSYNDLRLLSNKIRKADYDTWIGLYNSTTGALSWDDNSPVDFTYSADKQTINWNDRKDDLCASVRKSDLQWVFRECTANSYLNFICQIEKVYKKIDFQEQNNSTTKLTTTKTSSNFTTKSMNQISSTVTTKLITKQTKATVISQTTKTVTIPSLPSLTTKSSPNMTVLTTESIINNSTILTKNLTSASSMSLNLTTSTKPITKVINTTNSPTINAINVTSKGISSTTSVSQTTISIRNSTTESSQPRKGITTGAKVAIGILTFVVLIGICFGIYYIMSNHIQLLDLFKRKPKTNEIALREQGIQKTVKLN